MEVGPLRLDNPQDEAEAQQSRMEKATNRQRETLANVEQFLDSGQWADAGELCHSALTAAPENPEILYWMARVLIDTDKPAIAHPIAKQLVRLEPKKWQSWLMLGAVEAYLQRFHESRNALQKAFRINQKHPEILRLMANAMVMTYDFSGMKYAHESLELEDHHQAHTVLAFGYLHQRKWAKGWHHYHQQLGHVPFRELQNFGLPEWTGAGKSLVYAEQGLGDQIAYMSALKPWQMTCHPKLKNLFARTFREVHGDQFKTADWPITSDYQTSMASAMRYVEMKPRGAYLKPCPIKSAHYKARLEALGNKKKIGIGWTGGKVGSHGWKGRNLSRQELEPVLSKDYTFISLEYAKDAETWPGVIDWPEATSTDDYDDTAALVSNLDAVVTVPTTAYHLAGALGIEAHVLIHKQPHFHEGVSGGCPWWESVNFYRRKHGTAQAIQKVADAL